MVVRTTFVILMIILQMGKIMHNIDNNRKVVVTVMPVIIMVLIIVMNGK